MPFTNFDQIKTIDELLAFFTEYFPDAIDLIGKKRLIDDFFKATPQHLVSVKVKCEEYKPKFNGTFSGQMNFNFFFFIKNQIEWKEKEKQ